MASSSSFEKLPIVTLRGQIAGRIRDAILSGALAPGQRIVERALAAQFGASLTAVREGLIALESEGFIVKKANTATHVVKLTMAEADKIFALRRVLEAYALEEASRLARQADIERLEHRYVEMLDAARNNDLANYVQRDLTFHKATWHVAGNEYLEAALERIVVPLFAFSSMRFEGESTFDLLEDAHTHLALLGAIKSGEPAEARKVLLRCMHEWQEEVRAYVLREQP